MSKQVFTPKQCSLMADFKHNRLKRINVLEGSVRSGKTWISLVLWAFWVATMPQNGNYLMVAKTLTSLRRNILDLLEDLVGRENFQYSLSKKEGRLFGRLIYLEGVNDARAESKIRGMTLAGAYCDELTLFTEDFFAMLLSRLSEPGAKLIGTTNPDSPHHWFKTGYIDRKEKLNLYLMRFLIDDNTFLDPEYIRQLKKEYTGVFYDRFILGLWKQAEGLCYPQFADHPEQFTIDQIDPGEILYAVIGVDFGGNGSAHSFTLTGYTSKFREVITLDEFYLKKIITPRDLEQAFIVFATKAKAKYKVYEAYCDSAETTLISGLKDACIRAKLPIEIKNAIKGPVNDRIQFYNRLMAQGRYKVLRHCVHTIDAFSTAMYDPKRLDDRRLDDGTTNIDSLDSQEYSTENMQQQIIYLGGEV